MGFQFHNNYFSSPDADVLYCFVRQINPVTYLEIGSGNSTLVARQAIIDGGLRTKIHCIDPQPRLAVSEFADDIKRVPVETIDPASFSELNAGDILFIDSSHYVKTGSDVVYLFLEVLPRLTPGVVIHVHDIFLPYEYPREWVLNRDWDCNEQYLLQALLQFSSDFDVLWPGHMLQRENPEFRNKFPHMRAQDNAQSFWFRRKCNR